MNPRNLAHALDLAQTPTGTIDEILADPEKFALLVERTRRDANRRAMVECRALLAAGWTFELPDIPDPEVWQWYWRRPGKRPGKPGRLFLSPTQAYNALMREGKASP